MARVGAEHLMGDARDMRPNTDAPPWMYLYHRCSLEDAARPSICVASLFSVLVLAHTTAQCRSAGCDTRM
jgi:hypothetical protein